MHAARRRVEPLPAGVRVEQRTVCADPAVLSSRTARSTAAAALCCPRCRGRARQLARSSDRLSAAQFAARRSLLATTRLLAVEAALTVRVCTVHCQQPCVRTRGEHAQSSVRPCEWTSLLMRDSLVNSQSRELRFLAPFRCYYAVLIKAPTSPAVHMRKVRGGHDFQHLKFDIARNRRRWSLGTVRASRGRQNGEIASCDIERSLRPVPHHPWHYLAQ